MSVNTLGFGLGLRKEHYTTVLETLPDVDWFEVLTENYLVPGGKPLYFLDQVCEHYPVVMHGVSLSVGGVDALDFAYLRQVKALVKRTGARWVSDHLCWTSLNGINTHDLLPLPYTEEAVHHVSRRIRQVQDYLEHPFLIENLSSYISYKQSAMTEWEFLTAVAEEADCLILLDINNIYVSAFNHGFDPLAYLDGVPRERIQQHHIAGHSRYPDYIIDTHDHPVVQDVWDLYAEAVRRYGMVSTMIERDDNIPELPVLLEELQVAREIYQANAAFASGESCHAA